MLSNESPAATGAIWQAEIASITRLVDHHQAMQAMDSNERERARMRRGEEDAFDRQAIIDTLAAATHWMTSTEVANRSGVPPKRTEHLLKGLVADKTATRRRRATRRADGSKRNPYKYRIAS